MKEWTAPELLRLSGSYWECCALQAAVRLDLFTALADGPRTEEQLAAACLRPGGLLGLQEFALDNDRTGPAHPALFSLNMLVDTDGGQAYTMDELRVMLENAGAGDIRPLDLALPMGCRVLTGTV